MKILYVLHDFFPRFYGGTERYVLNLSKQMQRMGHSVTVLTYGVEDPSESFPASMDDILYKSYVYEGIPIISIRHKLVPGDIGFMIVDEKIEYAITKIIETKVFDVMHIAHPMRMACCYRAAHKLNIPVVLTLTDFWLLCPRGRFYKPDYSLCNSPDSGEKCITECGVNSSITERYKDAKKLFEEVDVLISPSRFLIGCYKFNGWTRNITHINHGVDYKYVKPLAPVDKERDIISFGYTGVVARFKGVDVLVNAFREVNSPGIALKIYGNCIWEPAFSQELAAAVEEDKRIRLMGKYDHSELPRVMSEIDITIVPSTTLESYGLVVVESMAYGVPVIASDIVGSAYEFIEHGKNGMVFSVQKPSELTDIIKQISDQPSIVETLKSNISPPPRLEEEAFMVESIYKRLPTL